MGIVTDETVRFGKPVIEGTRVAVKDVVDAFYEAGRSTETIASDFGIPEDAVEDALRYHYDHRQQIPA